MLGHRLMSGVADNARAVLVDAHVHFHACYPEDSFLNRARENFAMAARGLGLSRAPLGLLLFTESEGTRFFRRFRDRADGAANAAGWSFRRTQESVSLGAWRGGELELILIAGRQLVTAEGLEVLALCCEGELEDRRTMAATLDEVRRAGAVPAVPWGFGKWLFARGRLVAKLVKTQDPSDFFLGDNGGRLRGAPTPSLFAAARDRGIRILPGSDPLPFARHVRRVGSFGFGVSGQIDVSRPAAWLTQRLRDATFQPTAFGAADPLPSFVLNQVAMQITKRLARSGK
jgi:hypothetical protein